MKSPSAQLYDAAASRAIDAHAIQSLGVSGYTLMQRAADAAFALLLDRFPGSKKISVVCGKGNNAGDAYLVARRALDYGIHTQLIAVVDPASLSGDAALAYAQARDHGVVVEQLLPAVDPSTDAAGKSGAAQDAGELSITGEVVIDGVLGTGLSGAPRAEFAQAIELINASGKPVLSIDVPSGVRADNGAVYGEAVYADVTVSFITRKIGLYTGEGVSHAGLREFADLGVPAQMYVADGVPLLHWQASALPALDANTYKHRQGHVVIAGGDAFMPGAVAMAAHAALRVGAGMVTVLCQPQHSAAIVARTPEVMVMGFSPDTSDTLEAASALLERADVLVLGPGLGRSAWSQALFELGQASDKPTVLDADGLYWLSQAADDAWHGGALTMTPHTAEAAKLLGQSAQQIQQDRFGACTKLREKYNCQGVLKGAGSVVFGHSPQAVGICGHGNQGMASAGMGDVLSGVVGGLMAQDMSSASLFAGVTLHSAAGDRAAKQVGHRSLMATDVVAQLPALLAPDSEASGR